MKRLHALLLLLGFAFLAYLVWAIGIPELSGELILLGWGLAPFILLEFVAEGIHTLAWRFCLSGQHRQLSWFRLFQIRMAGYAINYLTPTAALGGEVSKAAFLASKERGPHAVSAVLAGKLCAGAGHFMFVAAGSFVLIGSATLPRPVWMAMISSGGLVAGGIVTFLLLQKYGKLGAVIRWLATHKFAGRRLQNMAREASAVDETLKAFYRERPHALALAIIWEMIGHGVGIFQTWWFFGFLHQSVSLTTAACVWVLGMWFDFLTFAVPMNMGTLEGSRIVAFKAIGSEAVMGMTYGVALRLAQLSCACFGLVNYLWLASRKGRASLAGLKPASLKVPVDAPVTTIGVQDKS